MADKAKAKRVAERRRLYKLQGLSVKVVENISSWVPAHGKSSDVSKLRVQVEQLELHYQRFLRNEELITEQVDSDDDDDFTSNYFSFEENYINTKSALLTLIDEKVVFAKPVPDMNASQNQSILVSTKNVKLPKLEPPKFSGSYSDWTDFKNEFTTMIINETDLNDVDRFRFLKSCLVGRATRILSRMEASQENFRSAWKALCTRYENKALILQSHINEIIQMDNVSKESSESVREMVDQVSAHFRAIKAFGSMQEVAENFLICLMLKKLDANNVEKWEESTNKEIPTWDGFCAFLEKRATTLEKLEYNKKQCNKPRPSVSVNVRPVKSNYAALTSLNSNLCAKCASTDHNLQVCPQFLALGPMERYHDVKRMQLCVVCLKTKHNYRFCKVSKCDKCHKGHHTLIHFDRPTVQPPSTSGVAHKALLISESFADEPAVLATALVKVFDANGLIVPGRALLDSGATTNFISERFVQTLNVERRRTFINVGGIGNTVTTSKASCFITLTPHFDTTIKFKIAAVILPKISDAQPGFLIASRTINVPPEVKCLANPNFFKPQKIDLLLGAGIFWHLLLPGQVRLGENLPIFQQSKLGWIIGGPMKSSYCKSTALTSKLTSKSTALTESNESLSKLVQRFWEVDAFPADEPVLSSKDQECVDHYAIHTRRNCEGSYIVRLPFSKDPTLLGESFPIAIRRFLNLEKRLDKQPEMKEMYSSFINEYEQLKHLETVENFDPSTPHCFLPHHSVMKLSSSSTKLRVVFDASCKTSSGVALNEILHSGPKLQDDLFIILLKFRLFEFVVTGDIQKMYRQVAINLPDSNYQLILWRNIKDEPIKTLRLCTVTYGTACGSYLAVKTLHRLAADEQDKYPIGARILRQNFYVDDMMIGSNSITHLLEMLNQSIGILKCGGFTLSKFCTNNDTIRSSIEPHHREKYLNIEDQEVVKTLGLIWQPETDVFRFTYHPKDSSAAVTKRVVLSEMARLFDPLGFVCPVITLGKIFYQELWKLKINWDEPLDKDLTQKWIKFRSRLSYLKDFSIPRFVMTKDDCKFIEVHAFSDASEKAYGACVYLRCGHQDGAISSRLVCAKSRVAPTKTISVARLELLAAKMMTDLVSRLKKEVLLELEVRRFFYWTDSLITLCWINAEPHNWNIFIAHRVSKIQNETSSGVWRHVPGNLNPADLISRGMMPADIADCEFWFCGPNFLKCDELSWPPIPRPSPISDEILEKRPVKFALSTKIIEDVTSSMHFSQNFRGTRRAFAYVMQFIRNTCSKSIDKEIRRSLLKLNLAELYSKVEKPTTAEEEEAKRPFIRNIQKSMFAQDYQLLKAGHNVKNNSRLKCLAPFLDDFGLLRVGGRLQRAKLPYSSKHQILLPKNHQFSKLLIHFFHFNRTFHAGPHIVLTAIRAKYWPINGLAQTRNIINKCIRCFRMRPKFLSQIMGNLPEDRLDYKRVRPFSVSGVDFAGPLYVRHHIRCKAPKKVYVALFICFATKAVHLELVIDLSTEAFIRSLKRFIADRGMVKKLVSDNATNFKGAANQLSEIHQMLIGGRDAIYNACDQAFVEWSFIPPRAPNFGGLWEASVKITKRLIKNVIGSMEVSVDELHTVIRQVATIVNSRPITPLSANPNDLEPLTPGHFLYGGAPVALPEMSITEENINRVKMLQRINWMVQQFWARFRTEYLATLQPRTKWMAKNQNIEIGAMVLVKDDTIPPLKWSLGRVVGTKPDKDGNVRILTIRTVTSTFDRAISGVAVLPIEKETKNEM